MNNKYKFIPKFGKTEDGMYCLIFKIPIKSYDYIYKCLHNKAKDWHKNIGNINSDISTYELQDTIFGENHTIGKIHPMVVDVFAEFIRRVEFGKRSQKLLPKIMEKNSHSPKSEIYEQ